MKKNPLDKKTDNCFGELLSPLQNVTGRTLEGTVYHQDNSYAYLDLGSKTNPRLSNRFLNRSLNPEDRDTLHVGKKMNFTIDEMETVDGDLLLTSPRRDGYDPKAIWAVLKDHYDNEEPVIGRILNPVKGGFSVGFAGFTAFLPNSHLVKGRSPSYSHWLKRTRPYIGALLYFKILELNPSKRNFVVSRIEALTPEGTLRRPSE
jgi:ribosomal protein S1